MNERVRTETTRPRRQLRRGAMGVAWVLLGLATLHGCTQAKVDNGTQAGDTATRDYGPGGPYMPHVLRGSLISGVPVWNYYPDEPPVSSISDAELSELLLRPMPRRGDPGSGGSVIHALEVASGRRLFWLREENTAALHDGSELNRVQYRPESELRTFGSALRGLLASQLGYNFPTDGDWLTQRWAIITPNAIVIIAVPYGPRRGLDILEQFSDDGEHSPEL